MEAWADNLPRVLHGRGRKHELTGGFNFRGHVCDDPAKPLKFADFLAELIPFLGVLDGCIQCRLSNADGLCRNADATTVQSLHDDLKPSPSLAQKIFRRYPAVFKDQIRGVRGPEPQFVLGSSDNQTRGFWE